MQFASMAAAALIGLNLLALPYFLFLLVTSLAALAARSRTTTAAEGAERCRFLIVIPAHNEEAGLAATVRSCLDLDYPGELFQVVVIADNCTDSTAAVARAAGAGAAERHDDERKSKGFAIEWLIDAMKARGELDSHDALVVIDADSTASPNLLRAFAACHARGIDWAQCFYTVANPNDSWRTRLLTYAFSLFNGVIPLGQWTLGQSAGFKGNGMCFTTRGLARVPWRCRGLVEDMEYAWEVRLAGGKIAFVPEARVFGMMLSRGGRAAAAQRRRWEFGRKALKARVLPALWKSPHLGFLEKAVSLVELTLPTLALLAGISALLLPLNAWAAARLGWLTASSLSLFGMSVLVSLSLVVYAICPFVVFRLPWTYLMSLLHAPFYAAWKVLVALGGRPTQWVRTAREEPANR
jgi:cellulose synthase/poly-beta-1,6-N-acetylglucosamine synthase-like glycosyltransferase